MRLAAKALRLAVLVGVLVFLLHQTRIRAQGSTCATFETQPPTCGPGCPGPDPKTPNLIVGMTSTTGVQSPQLENWSCGGTAQQGCAGQDEAAEPDPACCTPAGQACNVNASTCCSGTFCDSSTGKCTVPPPPPPNPCAPLPSSGGSTPQVAINPGDPCVSPILLDTKGDGFHLTDAADGVLFHVHANDPPVQIAWTASGPDGNAFLALDRNNNGKIDDMTELFGNVTPQPSSDHPNGFLALAVFDQPENGGNGDGIIDARDAIFPHLLLWIDENHDGISQPNELHSLASLGVYSISLKYHFSLREDQYGNLFRFRGRVNPDDPRDTSEVGHTAYDVFFVRLQ